MSLNIIFAMASNGTIGINNTLPWHLPEDLAHFKEMTTGASVIMGRNTWESLPLSFRPLPGRHNIVISRKMPPGPGYTVSRSLVDALTLADAAGASVWVIGGAQVYAQAMPLADRIEVTEVAKDFVGDAWAPSIDPDVFELTSIRPGVSRTGLPYSFKTYLRRQP